MTTNMTKYIAPELEFGIPEVEYSIQQVNIDGVSVILKEDEIINPFFSDINKRDLDSIEQKDLYKYYKSVYILCMKNEYVHNEEALVIFNKILTKEEYNNLNEYFTLQKCSRNLLFNKLHYENAKIINKEHLILFENSYEFENTEIVVPILEMKQGGVLLYNSLYDTQFNLSELEDILSLIKYFSVNGNGLVMRNISNKITELKESEFWKNPNNCNLNMTELFNQRSFQYKDIINDKNTVLSNKILSNDGDDLLKNVFEKLSNTKNPYELNNDSEKKKSYIDIAGALQNSVKRTYYATDPNSLEFNRIKINELFSQLSTEREQFDVFNALLVSKDYCHLVLNNNYVLDKMLPIINKYLPLYKYLFGYAWLSFYTEECIFKTKTTRNSRYVFDINTASKLPVFPYCTEDIHQNPYVTVVVSEKCLQSNKNCLSLPMIENFDGYGITNLDEFRKRFNIFTNADPNKNILDDIDWSCFAVSGSIIPACLMKRSPLFDYVTNNNQEEKDKWLTFFNHYYSDSDIDLMCNKDSVFEFMDKVKDVISCIQKNIKGDVAIEPIKSMAIIITSHYISERLDHIRDYTGTQWTEEEVIKNLGSDLMKEYFYRIYCDAKLENNRKNRKIYKSDNNQLYNEYYKLSAIDSMNINLVTYDIDKNHKQENDSEICYFLNDFRDDNKLLNNKNLLVLKISENIKFKIKGNGMMHSIETFRVKGGDFFSVVSRFHLPCVRAYYTGENVHILPSCVTALMTGINIEYKYFAGIRDPIDILKKYDTRGFGTLLNKNEKDHMLYYIGNVPKWNTIYKLPSNKKDAMDQLFGSKEINHDIYKPLLLKGHARDIYRHQDLKYIKNINDLVGYYKEKYNYNAIDSAINMFKLKTINKDGNVEPFKSWVSKAFYEVINSN